MKKSSFIAAFVTILMMVAPSKMSAQEENGFKKFSVEENFEDNGFQWFRDAQLLATGNKEKSNAIPTMQGGVETIRPYVNEFIQFAKEHPKLTFLVTRIGCGIAGFTDEEIAPLFEKAHDVENIVLPPNW